MSAQDLITLLQFFKALANESCLKLVGAITQQERSVEELASILLLNWIFPQNYGLVLGCFLSAT